MKDLGSAGESPLRRVTRSSTVEACPAQVDTLVEREEVAGVKPTRGTASRIPVVLEMRVTGRRRGDIEIAAPHVRVVPGASTALGFSTDMCATGGMAAIVVMRPSRPIGART